MSSGRGRAVVAWLERGGDRYLRCSEPEIYEQLMLHVGATDLLCHYSASTDYWHCVQKLLDAFFTLEERAALCAELVDDPQFGRDPGFWLFLIQACAEIRTAALVRDVEASLPARVRQRSLG